MSLTILSIFSTKIIKPLALFVLLKLNTINQSVKTLYITLLMSFAALCVKGQYTGAELLNCETSIYVNNGKLVKDHHFQLKILNRRGENYATIQIPYSKLLQLSKVSACIKDANGKLVRKIKKKEIAHKSVKEDFSFYEDQFVLEFTLKHNQYPYVIEYSYQSVEDNFLFVEYWLPVIHLKIPTQTAKLSLSVPTDYKFKVHSANVKQAIVDSLGNKLTYRWEASYHDFLEEEPFSPFVSDSLPSVVIVPEQFMFEKTGTFNSWITYGDWQHSLLEGLNYLPQEEKNRIDLIVKEKSSSIEKVKALFHYLQDETRYLNVAIETGGMKPYPASYVSKNKYGDCKALTNYFKSVLDYIGQPSYYSLIYAGDKIRNVKTEFPSQQFNHVILYVPMEKDTLWIDCTSDGPFNYVGTFIQNRMALVIDEGRSRFVKTPALSSKAVLEQRNVHIKLKTHGESELTFENTYRGDVFERMQQVWNTYNESQKKMILRQYFVPENETLLNYEVLMAHRDSAFLQFNYTSVSKNLTQEYGRDLLVKNLPFSKISLNLPEERKMPLQVNYPIHRIDRIQYSLPPMHKVEYLMPKQTISERFGSYQIELSKNDEGVFVLKQFHINAKDLDGVSYSEFYEFFRKVNEIERKSIITLIKTN